MDKIIARITGLGAYLPSRILSNKELESIVDTTDEWIVSRTGMRERRIASQEETPSVMGAAAAKKAITDAAIDPQAIDLIICATISPDHLFPSTSCIIQQILGIGCAAFDINAACSGFLYALDVATAYITAGKANTVLVIASEKISSFVDYSDRGTCILFGDGAAAAIVTNKGAGLAIRSAVLGADGELAQLLRIPAGGSKVPASIDTVAQKLHYIQMDGKEVFKHAVRGMEHVAKEAIAKAGLTEKDIDYLVPHQANIRIIEAMAKRFSIEGDRVFVTVHKYGNTSASACAIALEELCVDRKITTGEIILLVAFGAGLTSASVILEQIDGT